LRAQERADESEAGRRRLAFLFKASQQLAASLEPTTVIEVLVHLIVPELGDGAVINVTEPGRGGRHATVASSDALNACPPAWWDWAERVTRADVSHATRLGRSTFGSIGGKHRRPADYRSSEVSYCIVPLRARDRTLGTFTLLSLAAHRRYRHDDLDMGEALDNALLYETQRAIVERLQEISGELDAAQGQWLRDDERRRIARDLHDHVEQTFFAIGLTAANALVDRDADGSEAKLAETLAQVGDLSNEGAEQLRAAIFALNHAEFASLGLIPALWKLVRSFQERTGVGADLVLTGSQRHVPTEVAETLHATAREALKNVERHARAGAVVLGLSVSPRSITLSVSDDGAGAPSLVLRGLGDSATHFGLRSLGDRVRRLHGTFAFGPGPDGGFLVRARFPLRTGPTG
jgi:signal transduction histidine kinase